jgi:exosortase
MISGVILSIIDYIDMTGVETSDRLSIRTLFLLIILLGTYLFFCGRIAFKKAIFPIFLLVFMIPIPESVLSGTVEVLRQGSTQMTAWLFYLTGTPYFREGTYFQLPSLNINIAPQCSGIRSSLALFITMLLAAHLMLKTGWKRVLLVLLAIPFAMLKNAIRITALSLLAIHVDMRILTKSSLHQEGGILFFLLALLIMMPVLFFLRRSESSHISKTGSPNS